MKKLHCTCYNENILTLAKTYQKIWSSCFKMGGKYNLSNQAIFSDMSFPESGHCPNRLTFSDFLFGKQQAQGLLFSVELLETFEAKYSIQLLENSRSTASYFQWNSQKLCSLVFRVSMYHLLRPMIAYFRTHFQGHDALEAQKINPCCVKVVALKWRISQPHFHFP